VLAAEAQAGARAAAHDHRDGQRAAGEVAGVRRLGDEPVERDADEVDEHHLDDRAVATHRGADGCAEEAGLGDRRIQHALRSELLQEALGDLERPSAAGDVLAETEHLRVCRHLIRERTLDRFADAQLLHRAKAPV
jgi:hypothetical protein